MELKLTISLSFTLASLAFNSRGTLHSRRRLDCKRPVLQASSAQPGQLVGIRSSLHLLEIYPDARDKYGRWIRRAPGE